MLAAIARLPRSRWGALALKETRQILRNRRLLFLLVFPPTIQLLLYGAALDPAVRSLALGVADYARTETSREFLAALTETQLFAAEARAWNAQAIAVQVRQGELAVGLIIPPDFERAIAQGDPAPVQALIDGVNANTAGIARGYLTQIAAQFERELAAASGPPLVDLQVTFAYNPGLVSSWFFVPGMTGVVLTLIGSLVSSAVVVREKDTGTLEQLLMTPASAAQILSAKIVPLFGLLMGDVLLALGIARGVFNVPFRGNLGFFLLASALYVLVSMGIGIALATLARSQQQVFLSSFFINLPLVILSGAIAPLQGMPAWLQQLSLLDPLRHYATLVREVMLKGAGWAVLWPNVLALLGVALGLLAASIWRFRAQLR